MNYFKLLLCLAALVSTTIAHGHGFFKSAPSHAYAYHPQHYSVGTAYLGKALFVSPPQPVFKAVPIIKTIAVAPPPPPPPTIIKTPVYIHLPPPPPPPPTIIRTPIFVHAAPLPPPPPPPSAIIHSYSGPVAPILPPPTYVKTFIPHVPPPPPPPPPQFFSYHQHTPVVKTVLPGWHHEAEHASFGPALQPHPVSVEANSIKFHSIGQPSSAYGPPSAPAW